MASQQERIVNVPAHEAFTRLQIAVTKAGLDLKGANPQTYEVYFSSPMSLTDWGFQFHAYITPINEISTRILFVGSNNFGFDLFDVKGKQINKVLAYF